MLQQIGGRGPPARLRDRREEGGTQPRCVLPGIRAKEIFRGWPELLREGYSALQIPFTEIVYAEHPLPCQRECQVYFPGGRRMDGDRRIRVYANTPGICYDRLGVTRLVASSPLP